MGRLEEKVAAITGAGSGIGRASALLFAEEGAQVIAADRDETAAMAVVEEIRSRGGDATSVRTDVSDPEQVEAMVAAAVEIYGRLDVLFNNAGIQGELATTADCTIENWEQVITINLRGVFLGMKYAIPQMLKRGGGVIINTASAAGLIAFPGAPAYAAAKGGVLQLTRTAAIEYARQGIRVNAICPGAIWTPLMENLVAGNETMRKMMEAQEPLGRFGRPEEIARMALFLASSEASFCTGAPFIVDGGLVAV